MTSHLTAERQHNDRNFLSPAAVAAVLYKGGGDKEKSWDIKKAKRTAAACTRKENFWIYSTYLYKKWVKNNLRTLTELM